MLVCTRRNGTSTWTQIDRFMALHDLAHYCVEQELKLKDGFYGLVTRGVDISDFEDKEKIRAKNLPQESVIAELIVGLILTERADNNQLPDFNKTLNETARPRGIDQVEYISPDQLNAIRGRLDELVNKWTFLPKGEALKLNFDEGYSGK